MYGGYVESEHPSLLSTQRTPKALSRRGPICSVMPVCILGHPHMPLKEKGGAMVGLILFHDQHKQKKESNQLAESL